MNIKMARNRAEILKEEIYADAVPKIVERGTKIPPTYIKPLSGGRLSSGFGGRKGTYEGSKHQSQGCRLGNANRYTSCCIQYRVLS